MIGQHDPRRRAAPGRDEPDAGAPRPRDPHLHDPRRHDPGSDAPPPFSRASPHASSHASPLRRFLGGSPATVLVKLLFLSVLVGAAMASLGLTPGLLFRQLYAAALWLIDTGLATVHDFGRWILAGAAVVVPLWLISRFLAMGR